MAPRLPTKELAAGKVDVDGFSDLAEQVRQLQAQVKLLKEQDAALREKTRSRLTSYRDLMQSQLGLYHAERAWQLMLCLRKAYTLLVRNGWAGYVEFFRWIASIPFARDLGLATYDVRLPDVIDYIPQEFWTGVEGTVNTIQEIPRQKKYDVIILPVFDFDFRYQRPQHLAVQFAMAGHRVFWISPTRTASGTRAYSTQPVQSNLWEVRLNTPIPNLYHDEWNTASLTGVKNALYSLCKDWAVAENCVILQLPFWRQVGLALREEFGSRILYDCMDHWDTFPAISAFVRAEERKLAAESDVLIVTAKSLLEKHTARGLSPTLVRNGADFEFFRQAGSHTPIESIRRPVIGYFGAIADWFDFDLVRDAAAERPDYSFVLIGGLGLENDVSGREIGKLRKLPNVHLLGHRGYVELPSFLHAFDVCIIPFRINEVTMATDPVKLYEYLCQGKPVVTTAMGELTPLSNIVYIARDATDFVHKLDVAIAENDPDVRARRIDFAAANSWGARHRTIAERIQDAFPLVSILVVTRNSEEFIKPCFDSIFKNTTYPNIEVIAVDNGSSDGTVALLREYADQYGVVSLVCLDHNSGFAAANNSAARLAKGEYIILLNADTMVTTGWIERLLRPVRRDSSIGLAGPVTNWAGNEMKIEISYRNAAEMEDFALHVARTHYGEVRNVSVAPLFCTLIPRAVWTRIGELDESFGVGMFEDDDYSRRVAQAGMRIVCVEDCFVHHFGKGSFNKLADDEYRALFDQNRKLFEKKWKVAWSGHRHREFVSGATGRFDPRTFVNA